MKSGIRVQYGAAFHYCGAESSEDFSERICYKNDLAAEGGIKMRATECLRYRMGINDIIEMVYIANPQHIYQCRFLSETIKKGTANLYIWKLQRENRKIFWTVC